MWSTILKVGSKAGRSVISWGKNTFGKAGTKATATAGAGGVAIGATAGYGAGVTQNIKSNFSGLLIIGGTAFALYKILKK
jgi:hypothetical protein